MRDCAPVFMGFVAMLVFLLWASLKQPAEQPQRKPDYTVTQDCNWAGWEPSEVRNHETDMRHRVWKRDGREMLRVAVPGEGGAVVCAPSGAEATWEVPR